MPRVKACILDTEDGQAPVNLRVRGHKIRTQRDVTPAVAALSRDLRPTIVLQQRLLRRLPLAVLPHGIFPRRPATAPFRNAGAT